MLTREKHYFWNHSKINFYSRKFSALETLLGYISVIQVHSRMKNAVYYQKVQIHLDLFTTADST